MVEEIVLSKSKAKGKKWAVKVGNKTVNFGAEGYEDYTIHKDPNRKHNYISRHQAREDWTKSGMKTAGFWSRWLLWNKPSLQKSITNTENKFKIKIKRGN